MKKIDESEAEVLRDQLLLRARDLAASVQTATGQKCEPPSASRNALADIERLETFCEQAQTKLIAANRVPPPANTAASAPAAASLAPVELSLLTYTQRLRLATGKLTVEEARKQIAWAGMTVTQRALHVQGFKTLQEAATARSKRGPGPQD